MDFKLSAIACFLLIFSVFTIAGNSIGMECYKINEGTSKDKPNNKMFLGSMIGAGVCATVISCSVIVYAVKYAKN